jgi:KDO2-lipid IV(A) lauroyltransferase
MKRPRNRAVDFLVYLAVRLIVGLCQAMSVEQSYRFADTLARVMYAVDRRHRKVAMENLRLAYGERYTEAERDRIVRGVYRHFCRMIMEMLHIPRKLHLINWRRRIRLSGHAPILEHLIAGGPVIMVTGHFGNWEMAGYLFGLFGFPSDSVYRPLDNPYLDRFIRKFREGTGQKMIAKKDVDRMVDVLERGGLLSFLADQDAGQRGPFVEFFGRPASTYKIVAMLAVQYDAPVVVGGAMRVGPGFRYEVIGEEVIEPRDWAGQPDPIGWITQRWTSALERMIRRDPEQYLWLHRRWKHQPQPRARKAKGRPEAGATGVNAPHATAEAVASDSLTKA